MNLESPGKSGTAYEVSMSLRKHGLLDGPIKSDWK